MSFTKKYLSDTARYYFTQLAENKFSIAFSTCGKNIYVIIYNYKMGGKKYG